MAAGLGEAASIAGLLSLAGQTLQAASTIYTFIHNYKGVSAEIDSVAGHVLRLQDLLVHVQKLMTNADLLNPPSPDMIARLRTGIATCQADLITWNGRIEALRNSQLSRPKKLLQKVKIASDHRFFSPIRSDISAHFQNLSTILGLLTCDTGFHLLQQVSTNAAVIDQVRRGQVDSTRKISDDIRDLGAKHDSNHQSQVQSLAEVQQKLDTIVNHHGTDHADTQRSLANIEGLLASFQGGLQVSMKTPRRRRNKFTMCAFPSQHVRRVQDRTSVLKNVGSDPKTSNAIRLTREEILLRLIRPCLLIYEESGRLIREVTSLEDRRASRLPIQERLALVRYVQNLRLLIWLLRKQSWLNLTAAREQSSVPSILCVQAGLTFSCQRCLTLRHMVVALKKNAARMDGTIPWPIHLPVTAIALGNWERFPLPSETQAAAYSSPPLEQIFNGLVEEEDQLIMTVISYHQ